MKARSVLALVACLSACGGEAESGEGYLAPHPAVIDFRDATGVEFRDCGVAAWQYESCGAGGVCRDPCSGGQRAPYECFIQAYLACEPAYLRNQYDTADSGMILREFFIVPSGDGCRIVQFDDYTHLTDYCRDVVRYACGTPQVTDSPHECWVNAGCHSPEHLVEDTTTECKAWN